ncbi:hypothetical protein M433DRAFT_159801 [Acidomyces richmondensis BFW]|nr:hypothetical protein M433DRAFT_159801 [Acidomyces richmondensis BFW]
MHEVVTLQFGQQANFIGTHYWNTQEAYFTYAGQDESPINHDISFRPGVGTDGQDTYTPRTLIYDLKGAFGTLRRENALYSLQHTEQSTQSGIGWGGAIIPLQLPPITPHVYQQALDQGQEPPQLRKETVRFWSDYNHIFYHPRSIVQLHDYELNSSLMPFELWSTGEELFETLDREQDLLDRDLRPFLEECDQLQGVQIFSGIDDAWGGFASKYVEQIADDLGKGCRWMFGLCGSDRVARETWLLQNLNVARSLYAGNGSLSMLIPIALQPGHLAPYVEMDASSRWQTSALQAVLLESLTLPTRFRLSQTARSSFDSLESTLSNEGNRWVALAGISIEDPSALDHVDSRMANAHANGTADGNLSDARETKLDMDFLPDFTAHTGPDASVEQSGYTFSSVESIRGAWNSCDEVDAANVAARDHFTESAHGTKITTYRSQLLFPLLSSYPRIFRFHSRPGKLAVKTGVSTSTFVANRIRGLEVTTRRMVGVEEREAFCDGLMTLAEEYEEGWNDVGDYDED